MKDVRTEKGLVKMSEAEYQEHEASLQPEKTYQELRQPEYPSIGDQLDAIMKWAFTEREIGLPEELKSLAGKCMAVKSKYPKTED
jgi:hypothetical protein